MDNKRQNKEDILKRVIERGRSLKRKRIAPTGKARLRFTDIETEGITQQLPQLEITDINNLAGELQTIKDSVANKTHASLKDRNVPDAHGIADITDLQTTLDGKIPSPAVAGTDGQVLQLVNNVPTWSTIQGGGGAGGGVTVHEQLTGRDAVNQHPITAITNLETTIQTITNNVDAKISLPAVPPRAGQYLSYDGQNFVWIDPPVIGGGGQGLSIPDWQAGISYVQGDVVVAKYKEDDPPSQILGRKGIYRCRIANDNQEPAPDSLWWEELTPQYDRRSSLPFGAWFLWGNENLQPPYYKCDGKIYDSRSEVGQLLLLLSAEMRNAYGIVYDDKRFEISMPLFTRTNNRNNRAGEYWRPSAVAGERYDQMLPPFTVNGVKLAVQYGDHEVLVPPRSSLANKLDVAITQDIIGTEVIPPSIGMIPYIYLPSKENSGSYPLPDKPIIPENPIPPILPPVDPTYPGTDIAFSRRYFIDQVTGEIKQTLDIVDDVACLGHYIQVEKGCPVYVKDCLLTPDMVTKYGYGCGYNEYGEPVQLVVESVVGNPITQYVIRNKNISYLRLNCTIGDGLLDNIKMRVIVGKDFSGNFQFASALPVDAPDRYIIDGTLELGDSVIDGKNMWYIDWYTNPREAGKQAYFKCALKGVAQASTVMLTRRGLFNFPEDVVFKNGTVDIPYSEIQAVSLTYPDPLSGRAKIFRFELTNIQHITAMLTDSINNKGAIVNEANTLFPIGQKVGANGKIEATADALSYGCCGWYIPLPRSTEQQYVTIYNNINPADTFEVYAYPDKGQNGTRITGTQWKTSGLWYYTIPANNKYIRFNFLERRIEPAVDEYVVSVGIPIHSFRKILLDPTGRPGIYTYENSDVLSWLQGIPSHRRVFFVRTILNGNLGVAQLEAIDDSAGARIEYKAQNAPNANQWYDLETSIFTPLVAGTGNNQEAVLCEGIYYTIANIGVQVEHFAFPYTPYLIDITER